MSADHHSKPNAWVSIAGDGTTQLAYDLQIDPAPLMASLPPPEIPILASLVFVITNQTANPIAVTSIKFTFQAGTDSDDLMSATGGIQTDVSDSVNWQVTGPSSTITSGPAAYTLGPATGSSVTIAAGASVNLQVYDISVNSAFGITTVAVKEMIGSTAGFANFDVTKFPYGFYFNGLTATVPSGSSLVPVAQVGYNTPVTLVWNASVVDTSAFTIFYATNAGQQQASVTTLGEWVSPNLTRDTVFTLEVTVDVVGGQPATFALTTSVAVQQPDVMAHTLDVAGGASIGGTLDGHQINATEVDVAGSLNVTSGGQPNSTANISVPLTVNGSTRMIQGATQVQAGTYTATTDGLVIGYVTNQSKPIYCWGWIAGSCGAVSVQATGGEVTIYASGGGGNSSVMSSTFVLPVMQGVAFSLSAGAFSGTYEPAAPYTFWFVPIGAGHAQLTKVAEPGPDLASQPEAAPPAYRQDPVIRAILETLILDDAEEIKNRLKGLLQAHFGPS